MGRIEDLAAEMRTAGMSIDDNMLYTVFHDTLPVRYEVEGWRHGTCHLVTALATETSSRLFENGIAVFLEQPS